jgi:hypothetical protein
MWVEPGTWNGIISIILDGDDSGKDEKFLTPFNLVT